MNAMSEPGAEAAPEGQAAEPAFGSPKRGTKKPKNSKEAAQPEDEAADRLSARTQIEQLQAELEDRRPQHGPTERIALAARQRRNPGPITQDEVNWRRRDRDGLIETEKSALLGRPFEYAVEEAKQDVQMIRAQLEWTRDEVVRLEAKLQEAMEIEKRALEAYESIKPGDEVPDVLIPKRFVDSLAGDIEDSRRREHGASVDTSKIEAALQAAGLREHGTADGGWFVNPDTRVDGHYEYVTIQRERRLAECEKRSILDALERGIAAYCEMWRMASVPEDAAFLPSLDPPRSSHCKRAAVGAYNARIEMISSAGGVDPVGAALRREAATGSCVAPSECDEGQIGELSRLQAENQPTGPPN